MIATVLLLVAMYMLSTLDAASLAMPSRNRFGRAAASSRPASPLVIAISGTPALLLCALLMVAPMPSSITATAPSWMAASTLDALCCGWLASSYVLSFSSYDVPPMVSPFWLASATATCAPREIICATYGSALDGTLRAMSIDGLPLPCEPPPVDPPHAAMRPAHTSAVAPRARGWKHMPLLPCDREG